MSKAELLKKIYANPEIVFDYLHPDFTLHSPGQSQVAGNFKGADGLVQHLGHLDELSGGSFNHDVKEAYLADDKWGMVVHFMEGERNGMKIAMNGFGIWKFEGDKITDHWESVADQEAWDSFWS